MKNLVFAKGFYKTFFKFTGNEQKPIYFLSFVIQKFELEVFFWQQENQN